MLLAGGSLWGDTDPVVQSLKLEIRAGAVDVVRRALVEHPGLVHLRDEDGETALHHAARFSDDRMVMLLLNSGAAADVRNARGETALECAAGEAGKLRLLREAVGRPR